jgi:hypothetical protein
MRHAYVDVTTEMPMVVSELPVLTEEPAVRTAELPVRASVRAGAIVYPREPLPAVAPRRSRLRRIGVGALVAVLVAVIGVAAGFGIAHLSQDNRAIAGPLDPSPSPSLPAFTKPALVDGLAAPGAFVRSSYPSFHSVCDFDDQRYQVTMTSLDTTPSIRCKGPADTFGDFRMSVNVTLLKAGSCAGIWFRLTDAGYALRVCGSALYLGKNGQYFAREDTFPAKVPVGTATRIGITAVGDTFSFSVGGTVVGGWQDAANLYPSGRIDLGMFQTHDDTDTPYRVAFDTLEVDEP